MGVTVILHIYVESNKLESVCNKLRDIKVVTDLYEVTGEYDVVAIVDVENIVKFREFLKSELLKIEGVKAVTSSVVLHTYKRGEEVLEI